MRKRQIVITLSIIYLAVLTSLAGYALHTTTTYSLPIANIVPALTLTLPPLAGLAIESVISVNERLAAKGQIQTSRVFQLTVAFFLVFEAVLATLAGTHIGPQASLKCALQERWQRMYVKKDATHIRRIQDAFDCCGFGTTKHMAYPFSTDANTCAATYNRDTPCLGPWQGKEREVGSILMAVVVGVFVWKVIILLSPSSESAWLPSHVRLAIDDGRPGATRHQSHRQAIAYRDVEADVEADVEDSSIRREVTNLNNDSRLATHVEGNRQGRSALDEVNQWRGEPNAGP